MLHWSKALTLLARSEKGRRVGPCEWHSLWARGAAVSVVKDCPRHACGEGAGDAPTVYSLELAPGGTSLRPAQFSKVRPDAVMNKETRPLVDSLRRGQYEDPTEKVGLLSAALREHAAEAAELVSLLRAFRMQS